MSVSTHTIQNQMPKKGVSIPNYTLPLALYVRKYLYEKGPMTTNQLLSQLRTEIVPANTAFSANTAKLLQESITLSAPISIPRNQLKSHILPFLKRWEYIKNVKNPFPDRMHPKAPLLTFNPEKGILNPHRVPSLIIPNVDNLSQNLQSTIPIKQPRYPGLSRTTSDMSRKERREIKQNNRRKIEEFKNERQLQRRNEKKERRELVNRKKQELRI